MRSHQNKIDASCQKLQECFFPFLHKWITERRRLKALNRFCSANSFPDEKGLLSLPLFHQWPEKKGKALLSSSRLAYFEQGSTLVLNGEPLSTSDIVWAISGRLTELPTKEEIIKCAKDYSDPSRSFTGVDDICSTSSSRYEHEPLTGPLVFPQLFAKERSSQGFSCCKFFRMTLVHELIVERLETFVAGDVVGSECLLLGSVRKRAIHCLTPVIAYLIPLRVFYKELASLSSSFRGQAITVAKSGIKRRLTRQDDKPSMECILQENPILSKIDSVCLQKVWSSLTPFVFKQGEVVCDDAYVTDNIFFLLTGAITFFHAGKGRKSERIAAQRGAGIGIDSFIACRFPTSFKDSLLAVSSTYSEMWGISFQNFVELCKDTTSCVLEATKLLASSSQKLQVLECLKSIPGMCMLPDYCLQRISKRMKIRVYGPKQCVIPLNRCVREGLIFVVGKAYIKYKEAGVEKSELIRSGEPYFFYETLMKKVLPSSVFSETSVIVLCCSPTLIVEEMEESNCSSSDIELLYDFAAKYLIEKYGHHEPRIEAQERAAARVVEYDRSLRPPRQRPSNAAILERMKMEELQIQNEIITILEIRMQSLHRDPVDELRDQYFTDFSSYPLSKGPFIDAQEKNGVTGRQNSSCFLFKKPTYCSESVFSVDDRGNITVRKNEIKGDENPSSGSPQKCLLPFSDERINSGLPKDKAAASKALLRKRKLPSKSWRSHSNVAEDCLEGPTPSFSPLLNSFSDNGKPRHAHAEQEKSKSQRVSISKPYENERKEQRFSQGELPADWFRRGSPSGLRVQHPGTLPREVGSSSEAADETGIANDPRTLDVSSPLSSFSGKGHWNYKKDYTFATEAEEIPQKEASCRSLLALPSSPLKDTVFSALASGSAKSIKRKKRPITEVISQFRVQPFPQRSDNEHDKGEAIPFTAIGRARTGTTCSASPTLLRTRIFRGKRNTCLTTGPGNKGTGRRTMEEELLGPSLLPTKGGWPSSTSEGTLSHSNAVKSPLFLPPNNHNRSNANLTGESVSVSESSFQKGGQKSTRTIEDTALGVDFRAEFRRQSMKPSLPWAN